LVNLDESGQTHAFKSPTTRPKREINDDVWSTCFYSCASTAGALDWILGNLRLLPKFS